VSNCALDADIMWKAGISDKDRLVMHNATY